MKPIFAKKANRKKPTGRGLRKRDSLSLETDSEDVELPSIVLSPATTKTLIFAFHERLISIEQIDDYSWWEKADNPYGGRLWPSALGIAQYLMKGNVISTSSTVLELGCGTGLPSLVAASMGARVLATDVSIVALRLLSSGWKGCYPKNGCLSSQVFDIMDVSRPLPIANIVIASAVLYDSNLALGLAKRVIEACNNGAWVILGDDVTGERDGGRIAFLKLMNEAGVKCSTMDMTVANESLGWHAKAITLTHFNAPTEEIKMNQ